MRAPLAVLLVLLLAGCTQGTPGDGTEFQPSCPSWIKYPHNGQIIEGAMLWSNQSTNPSDLTRWDFMKWNETRGGHGLGDGLLEYDGHPLDQMVLDFRLREKQKGEPGQPNIPSRRLYIQDGELHMRFYANEGGYPGQRLEAYEVSQGKSSLKAEWVFTSDPARHWSLYNMTFHIDLAQPDEAPAPVGVYVEWELIPDQDRDRDTATVALIHYAPELWYRTCSSDGSPA